MDFGLPSKDTAETIQSLVTTLGIILAGAWAFWRWSLSEYFRHRHDIPSFDGLIRHSCTRNTDSTVVLSVTCVWRNVGNLSLNVDTNETCFRLYSVPKELELGPIAPRMGMLPKIQERQPWDHWPNAVLEPKTESEFQAHFIVPKNMTFIVECRLVAKTNDPNLKQVWVREHVLESKGAIGSIAP